MRFECKYCKKNLSSLVLLHWEGKIKKKEVKCNCKKNKIMEKKIVETKKQLLKEWETTQEMFYNYLDFDELERDYKEWFKIDIKVDNDNILDVIQTLINDELEYRKQDSICELKEHIEYIKSLSRI